MTARRIHAFAPGDWEASGHFIRTPLVANSRGGCDGGFAVAAIHPNVNGADVAARLMAAAPELYEALASVEREGRDANADGDVLIPSCVWDSVRSALAKARGVTA